jgi:hypothetical protein
VPHGLEHFAEGQHFAAEFGGGKRDLAGQLHVRGDEQHVGFLGADEGVERHRPRAQVSQVGHQALGLTQVEELLPRQRRPPQLQLHVREEPLKGPVGGREVGFERRQPPLLGHRAGGREA